VAAARAGHRRGAAAARHAGTAAPTAEPALPAAATPAPDRAGTAPGRQRALLRSTVANARARAWRCLLCRPVGAPRMRVGPGSAGLASGNSTLPYTLYPQSRRSLRPRRAGRKRGGILSRGARRRAAAPRAAPRARGRPRAAAGRAGIPGCRAAALPGPGAAGAGRRRPGAARPAASSRIESLRCGVIYWWCDMSCRPGQGAGPGARLQTHGPGRAPGQPCCKKASAPPGAHAVDARRPQEEAGAPARWRARLRAFVFEAVGHLRIGQVRTRLRARRPPVPRPPLI